MAQLPRGLAEAASQSIDTYGAQIIEADRILDNEAEGELRIVSTNAHGAIFATFGLSEESIIDALQAFIKDRRESIRILSEGLAEAEGD